MHLIVERHFESTLKVYGINDNICMITLKLYLRCFLTLNIVLQSTILYSRMLQSLSEAAECKNAVREGLISLANHPTGVSGQNYLLLLT